MTVNQIIHEVRKNYSVGVTPWRATRAKEIAMDCMVGDGQRQYALLYGYVAELLRVKAGTFNFKFFTFEFRFLFISLLKIVIV